MLYDMWKGTKAAPENLLKKQIVMCLKEHKKKAEERRMERDGENNKEQRHKM
jgi:hypothetical protein